MYVTRRLPSDIATSPDRRYDGVTIIEGEWDAPDHMEHVS